MKIVLDTNCLLPILIRDSYGYDIWRAFRDGKYTLCVSNEILLEYEEVLLRHTGSREFTDAVLSAILNAHNVERISPSFRFNLITSDPDDNKFVDCAITAGAKYIVSNDKHFEELDHYDFPKVECCKLNEFLQILRMLK